MGNNKKVAVLNCQNLLVVNCQKVMEINCQNLLVSTCRLQKSAKIDYIQNFQTNIYNQEFIHLDKLLLVL